jgi:Uma2 family endonuclease
MLITTRSQAVEVYRRTTEGWLLKSYRTNELVELASLGISLTVEEIYRDSTVLP